MPEDDALKRLMQQKRPSVSPRQDRLTPKTIDANTSLTQDTLTEAQSTFNREQGTGNSPLEGDARPESVDLPEVVRTTARLEKSVDKALRQLCMATGVTKEVWFEAAYLYLAEHPEELEAVNQIALERLERRKRAADLRKLRTMQKRLSGEF